MGILNEKLNPWHVCTGHCRDDQVFDDDTLSCVASAGINTCEKADQGTGAKEEWSCPDCLAHSGGCNRRSVRSSRNVFLGNGDREARISGLVERLNELVEELHH